MQTIPKSLLVLYVALGGAVGSTLRFYLAGFIERLGPDNFPIGILSINVLGSFLIGVFIEVLAHFTNASQELRMFVATGLLGGFTTFSAFSLESVTLLTRGSYLYAACYIGGTVILSILAVYLGMALLRWFFA